MWVYRYALILLILTVLRCFYIDWKSTPPPVLSSSHMHLVFQIATLSQFGTRVQLLERNKERVFEKAVWKTTTLSSRSSPLKGEDDSLQEGDIVSGFFSIERLHVLSNPGDCFNDRYYFRKNIFWKIETITIASVTHQQSFFEKLRSHILTRFKKYKSFNYFALLTLGFPDREESYEKITELGISHLFVISGLHFGIIFYFVFQILISFFSYHRLKTCLVVSFILISFYFLLCYPHVCLTRAYIVICCMHVNLFFERKTSVLALLIVTSALLLLISPPALFDISFQLSSVALLSLCLSLPLVEKKSVLRKLIISCAFIYVGTAPIILFYFQKISLTGYLLNLILIPLFSSLVMPLLFTSLFISIVSLEFPILFVLDIFFRIFEKLLYVIPPVSCERGIGSGFELLSLYAPLFLLFLFLQKRLYRKAFTTLGVLLLIFILYPLAISCERRFQKDLSITYLDVGHGDALVVHLPQGKTMLIDAGVRFHEYDIGKKVIKPYFLRNHINKIDVLVISHPDQDHIGGMPTILKEFKVGEVWLSQHALRQHGIEEIKVLARTIKIPLKIKSFSSKFVSTSSSRISFLWPPPNCESRNNNDCCLVFSLEYGKYRFWFTGDIGVHQEEMIVSDIPPNLEKEFTNILKIAHHGSKTSTSSLFVEKLKPQLAIISSGFRKPVRKVLDRLQEANAKILRTDAHGAIMLHSDGKEIRVKTECRR